MGNLFDRTYPKIRRGAIIGGIWGIASGIFLFITVPALQSEEIRPFSFTTGLFLGLWVLFAILIGQRKAITKNTTPRWIILSFVFCIIITIITPTGLLPEVQRAKRKNTYSDMRVLGDIIGTYSVTYEHFPNTDNEGVLMTEMIHEKSMAALLLQDDVCCPSLETFEDGWGHPYTYISDGNSYTIISFGKGGQRGGDGFETDILLVDPIFPDKSGD